MLNWLSWSNKNWTPIKLMSQPWARVPKRHVPNCWYSIVDSTVSHLYCMSWPYKQWLTICYRSSMTCTSMSCQCRWGMFVNKARINLFDVLSDTYHHRMPTIKKCYWTKMMNYGWNYVINILPSSPHRSRKIWRNSLIPNAWIKVCYTKPHISHFDGLSFNWICAFRMQVIINPCAICLKWLRRCLNIKRNYPSIRHIYIWLKIAWKHIR